VFFYDGSWHDIAVFLVFSRCTLLTFFLFFCQKARKFSTNVHSEIFTPIEKKPKVYYRYQNNLGTHNFHKSHKLILHKVC